MPVSITLLVTEKVPTPCDCAGTVNFLFWWILLADLPAVLGSRQDRYKDEKTAVEGYDVFMGRDQNTPKRKASLILLILSSEHLYPRTGCISQTTV